MRFKFVLLPILLLSTPCLAQQGMTLNGRLVTDAGRAVTNTRVAIAGGPGEVTGTDGRFQIMLPNRFTEGERVILTVARAGWVINSPLDGEWNLPNLRLQSVQTLDVVIVRNGSKALWTHARIEKYVARLANEITKLKKESQTPKPVDFSQYLSEWAREFGFTPNEVKAQFDEWAKAVENSEDYKKLGLAAFYKKNFAEAATNFDKAAGSAVEKVKQSEERFYRDQLEAFETLRLAGNSYSELYQFREALERYTRAVGYVSKEKNPTSWAGIKVQIGTIKSELGIRVEAKEAGRFLFESADEFKQALTVYTREQLPQDWAMTQNNLGNVLQSLGERLAGEEGARLLAQAVEAYRQALTVYTREQLPQDWAMAQNNLGIALASQGLRQAGEDGARLLAQAVEAFRQALTIRTRERRPHDWATTQNNLGIVLQELGERLAGKEGARLLAQAVEAFRQALTIMTRKQLPQQWATTQNNLGTALASQGLRQAGEERTRLLAQAVEAYRQALMIRTREQLPQQWAMTQNNLGTALQKLGDQLAGEEGARLLAQAVEAYRQALTVFTLEHLPQQWATTQNNLGVALQELGERLAGEEGARLLAQAVEAFRQALTIMTREQLPQQWALIQNNLARAYYSLKDWGNAATCYQNALAFYHDYQEAYERASMITHELIFDFAESLELKRRWLNRHPDDLSAQYDFAENHFTTARFAECEQRIAALLIDPKLDGGINAALRMINIANLLALGKAEMAPRKLDDLIELVSNQPADFKVTWTFNGTLHFIGQHEKLAPHRGWLKQLFAVAQADNRDGMIKASAKQRPRSKNDRAKQLNAASRIQEIADNPG